MKKNRSLEKFLCLAGFLLVPIFFIVLYFSMTMTYEDLFQQAMHQDASVPTILSYVFSYLPRIGEFVQRVAVHFMTPQLTFGPDLLVRLFIAALPVGLIYCSTALALGRKPKLQYKDALIFLGIWLLLLIGQSRNIFMLTFSVINNYVLALLILVSFALLFRLKVKGDKWYKILGGILLGFLLGTSSEITPLAVLILIGGYALLQLFRRKLTFRELFTTYRLQTFATLSIILGLAFFYLGAGLSTKTGSAYAEWFDYVSPMEIFSAPLATVKTLATHFASNIEPIFYAIPLLAVYIFIEVAVFKKHQNYWLWQIILAAFCAIYMLAASVISIYDGRIIAPVLLAIAVATFMLISHAIAFAKINVKSLQIAAIALLILGSIIALDTEIAFIRYNLKVTDNLSAITSEIGPDGELIILDGWGEVGKTNMEPSLLLRLRQSTPFHW